MRYAGAAATCSPCTPAVLPGDGVHNGTVTAPAPTQQKGYRHYGPRGGKAGAVTCEAKALAKMIREQSPWQRLRQQLRRRT